MPIIQVPQPVPTPDFRITVLAFRNRFTHAEKVAMEEAAVSSAEMRVYLADLAASTFVDLHDERLIDGLSSLEAMGLIDPGRDEEIRSAPIQQIERPTN